MDWDVPLPRLAPRRVSTLVRISKDFLKIFFLTPPFVDKVFELCLKEIEKNKSPSSASKPTDQTEPGSTKGNWDCAVQ